jgi:multidrug efflux pump subunit AcrA (membrane-fusion protein)
MRPFTISSLSRHSGAFAPPGTAQSQWFVWGCLAGSLLSNFCWAELAWSQGPAPVRVVSVHEREVSSGQAFVGTVTPARKAVIGSAVSGRIVEFAHNEGDYVEEGEVLAQVLTGTIAIELAHAEAELRHRQEELAESEKSFPVEKQQADARLAAAKASRDNANSNYERQQALAAKRSTSQEAIDSARAKAEETEAMFLEAQAARRLVFEGPREQKIRQDGLAAGTGESHQGPDEEVHHSGLFHRVCHRGVYRGGALDSRW